MPHERKGSGLKNCIPLYSIHFYKTTDPVRHNFLRLDPFPRDLETRSLCERINETCGLVVLFNYVLRSHFWQFERPQGELSYLY